jgi:hypothetical protein
MSLTLALPYDDSKNKREPALNRSRSAPKAPRTRFMAEKLKDVSTDVASRDEFQQELERRSPETLKTVLQLKDQHISLSLSTQMFIDWSQALVVDMIQEVAAHVLSSSNPVQHAGGQPARPPTHERRHHISLSQKPLRQEIQRQKDSIAELKSELRLKLAVEKQIEVDRDIENTIKDESVELDKD